MSTPTKPYIADPQRYPNTFMSQKKNSLILDLEAVGDDVYQSIKSKNSVHKGFVLGHGIQSIQMDIQNEFKVNSIHGVFIGALNHKTPVVYYLERLQNSNGSAARTVEGRQNGKIVFSGIASLAKPNSNSNEITDPLTRREMSSIPSPNSLPTQQITLNKEHVPKEFIKGMNRLMNSFASNGIEYRSIDQKYWLSSYDEHKELARFWIRFRGKFDANSKQATLGFISGLCGESMPGQKRAVSSQQTLWFNQVDFNPNDWIYCELSALQQIRHSGNFLMCKFWDQNGEILASAMQELDLVYKAKF